MRSLSEPILEVPPVRATGARSVPFWPALAGVCLAVTSLGGLRALDYSTSLLSHGTPEEATSAPSARMQIGDVTWELATYVSAPSLQAFRDSFSQRCGKLRGIQSARCVTTILIETSPHGPSQHEFVDADFDPARALQGHLGGVPGDCTTRSAMAATALLAMGVPSRVVQLLPVTGRGHNVLEVWDEEHGWALFDPLFDSSYLIDGDFASSAKLAAASGNVSWRRPHDGAPDPNLFAGSTIVFPEPWLYTRVGERCATWPFRACFVQVGTEQFRYGAAQKVAHVGVALGVLLGLGWAVWWGRGRKAAERA